jgi:SAM-dependent methyltransferase
MYLDLMRALGWQVVGVDTSDAAVRHARESLGIDTRQGDLREVDLPERSFDAVTLSHALEHVPDPVDLLAEVRRVTKPGGRVAIVVPNVRSVGARTLGGHWFHLDTPRHLTNFSPHGLRVAIERSGLRIESLRSSARGGYLTALYSVRRARGEADTLAATDATFGARRLVAAAVMGAESALSLVGLPVGQELWAVARR